MDLNSASSSELELLPGIGPAKAGAIISHRTDINGFNSVDQLLDVKGIGPRTLERLRPLLTIGEPLLPSAEHEGARRGPVLEAHSHSVDNNKLEQETSLPIDINRAGLEELQAINGIGPVLAKRIIESRTQRPFRSVDELIRVKGIGRITLERIRPQVVVDQGKNPHP